MALWPAAQMPTVSLSGASVPVSAAGIQSAISTHRCAASNTFGAVRRQWRILLKNHSLEYVPPHFARYCGRIARALVVISAASATLVWSFHSQASAAGLFTN